MNLKEAWGTSSPIMSIVSSKGTWLVTYGQIRIPPVNFAVGNLRPMEIAYLAFLLSEMPMMESFGNFTLF